MVNDSPGCAFRWYCDWENICQLKPGQRLGEDIINVVLGVIGSTAGSPTTFLGTQMYPELRKSRFGRTKLWTEGLTRDKQWSLAMCDGEHWIAALIDWRQTSVAIYDPQYLSAISEKRHQAITAVSNAT